MFSNKSNASGSGDGVVTIIGPGVSIHGDISFSGYLRIQGEVVGDIACVSDEHGTAVVHNAGTIVGAVKAPNIVVGGRVQGPLEASDSIEIHAGAAIAGDARYRQIAIQEGGVIDGALIPVAPIAAADAAPHERRIAPPETPQLKQIDGPHAHHRRTSDHLRTLRRLGIAAVLVGVAAVAWTRHDRPAAPGEEAASGPAATPAPAHTPAPAAAQSAPSDPFASAKATEPPPAPTTSPTTAATPPAPEPKPASPTASTAPTAVAQAASAPEPVAPGTPKADSDRILTVQGTEVEKPADAFFISAKEAVVLAKKQRGDPGEGTRIEVGAGVKRRFQIAANEIVRVAEGRNLELFYQGRKVSPATIQGGAWIAFVPLAAGKPAPQ